MSFYIFPVFFYLSTSAVDLHARSDLQFLCLAKILSASKVSQFFLCAAGVRSLHSTQCCCQCSGGFLQPEIWMRRWRTHIADHSVRIDDDEGIVPSRPELAGRNPKGLIEQAESRFWMLAFGHDELLPEGEVSSRRLRRDRKQRRSEFRKSPMACNMTLCYRNRLVDYKTQAADLKDGQNYGEGQALIVGNPSQPVKITQIAHKMENYHWDQGSQPQKEERRDYSSYSD
jgi:hypothetical protein